MRLQSNWQPGLDHGWKIHFWDGALTWPAADRRPQLLSMWTPPQGCLRFLTTFLRASNPRWQNENHHVFYNLAFKVTLLNSHKVLVITRDSPVESGREHTAVWVPGSGAPWGPSWRLASTAVSDKTDSRLELTVWAARTEEDKSLHKGIISESGKHNDKNQTRW